LIRSSLAAFAHLTAPPEARIVTLARALTRRTE
jgi:hypothetical protein